MWVPGNAPLAQSPVQVVAFGGLVVLVVLLAGIMLWVNRRRAARVVRPLREFDRGLARLNAAADPGRRMPEPAAGGEIARLCRTVNATLDRLERATELQRRFAADASHELRTPITGLRTRIEVALADPDDTDLVGTLRDALRDAERLHLIVDDLLALTRLDSGPTPDHTPLDLTALVRDQLAGRSARVAVRAELQDGVRVEVNRPQMCRVLVNLFSNADRYATGTVEVRLRTDENDAVLEVSDDGPGIAHGDRERIFERFARVDSARSRDSGGSGLGLAVARDIVLAHGGRLYVGPSEHGARLVLRLPLYEAHQNSESPERRPVRGKHRPPPSALLRGARGRAPFV
ncbi:hypothetical protein GCM10010191_90810 [Actinomadura vinacea]|uniref:histidine kinase n=1 Tax=Actinomadura vinacea TaxID=115336 RepID=A0ABP5XIM0_9ACTN